MSIKEGYKMTELGEIPEEWKVKDINHLIKDNIILDVMDGNHGEIHPKATDYTDIGIPFIMANNLKSGKIDVENCKFISYKQVKSLRKGFAVQGDVLLTHKGTLGETAIVPKLKDSYIVLTPQVTYYRLSNNNVLINRYLKIYFDSKRYQDMLKSIGSQSTRDYVGITEQKKLPIVLPTLKEQEKIASILSTVDEQIDNVDALIDKNKELKKGLMQTLLTKGIGHTKFKKTEMGDIPEEWEIKTIKDIVYDINQGINTAIEKTEFVDDGICMLKAKDINNYKINLKDVSFIKKEIFDGYSDRYKLKYGDILFTNIGSDLGKASIFNMNIDCSYAWNVMRLDIKKDICNQYIFYLINSNKFYIEIKRRIKGTGMGFVSKDSILNIKIIIPTVQEQEKIASILSSVDNKIDEYEGKKQRLEELKKGLMQQLLTGKIRVI